MIAWLLKTFLKRYLTTSEYHQKKVFCLGGSDERSETTADAMVIAAGIRLFRIQANVFYTLQKGLHTLRSVRVWCLYHRQALRLLKS